MRSVKLLAAVVLTCVMMVGCSGGGAPEPADATAAAASASRPADPIAAVAYDFLDAVVHGDTATATKQLTPTAIAQFEATHHGFASPEIGAPDFRIGEVRSMAPGRVAVECVLRDGEGEAEMLCLMRQVAAGWRVSGVAYETSPNEPPVVLNFEEVAPLTPPVGAENFVQQPAASPAAPRTAAESAQPPLR